MKEPKPGTSLATTNETREIKITFSELKKLFTFAEKNLNFETSYGAYVSEEDNKIQEAVPFPEEFRYLLPPSGEQYYLVYYTNRNDPYNAKGTRGRTIGISTSPFRKNTNERVKEIEFKEPGSDENDSHMYMTVMEKVNEQSFTKINEKNDEEVEMPHGSAEITYSLRDDGKKEVVGSRFDRLDEGLFDWKGQKQPVRWVRRLRIENKSARSELVYSDYYIIGRTTNTTMDERAEVKTTITGTLDNPEKIKVTIGSDYKGKEIFNDDKLQVFVGDPIGQSDKDYLEILKQDPTYGQLLTGTGVDVENIISIIQSKIKMLQVDWDKPHNIFGGGIESSDLKSIEN